MKTIKFELFFAPDICFNSFKIAIENGQDCVECWNRELYLESKLGAKSGISLLKDARNFLKMCVDAEQIVDNNCIVELPSSIALSSKAVEEISSFGLFLDKSREIVRVKGDMLKYVYVGFEKLDNDKKEDIVNCAAIGDVYIKTARFNWKRILDDWKLAGCPLEWKF